MPVRFSRTDRFRDVGKYHRPAWKRKRDRGTGSIYYSAARDRWIVEVRLQGKRIARVCKTQLLAEAALLMLKQGVLS